MNEINKGNKMESKRLETKLERKTTIMKNHELIKLFSKTKSFANVIKELNKAELFLDLDSDNKLISSTDWSKTWHTDDNQTFEFMSHHASFTFTHKDGHSIHFEVSLRSKFKLSQKGSYDNIDVLFAKKMIPLSLDYNSDTLKATYEGGGVFVSSPHYYNDELISKGNNDSIEGGFATIIKCLTSEEYSVNHIGLYHSLQK